MYKLFPIFFLLLIGQYSFAQWFEIDGITYSVVNSKKHTAYVMDIHRSGDTIVIPPKIIDDAGIAYKVVKIDIDIDGRYKKIVLPKNIKEIQFNGFKRDSILIVEKPIGCLKFVTNYNDNMILPTLPGSGNEPSDKLASEFKKAYKASLSQTQQIKNHRFAITLGIILITAPISIPLIIITAPISIPALMVIIYDYHG